MCFSAPRRPRSERVFPGLSPLRPTDVTPGGMAPVGTPASPSPSPFPISAGLSVSGISLIFSF